MFWFYYLFVTVNYNFCYVVIVLIFLYYYRDFDGAIVRPLPRIKRALSEATCLPHIVQVALLLILSDFSKYSDKPSMPQ